MINDHEKTFKRDVIERLNKAKGRLQQSVPEIRQLIKKSDVVETARKISDPKNIERINNGLKKLADANLPQAIIKQAVIDFQLKDLFAKAESLVVKASAIFAKMFSKEGRPMRSPAVLQRRYEYAGPAVFAYGTVIMTVQPPGATEKENPTMFF